MTCSGVIISNLIEVEGMRLPCYANKYILLLRILHCIRDLTCFKNSARPHNQQNARSHKNNEEQQIIILTRSSFGSLAVGTDQKLWVRTLRPPTEARTNFITWKLSLHSPTKRVQILEIMSTEQMMMMVVPTTNQRCTALNNNRCCICISKQLAELCLYWTLEYYCTKYPPKWSLRSCASNENLPFQGTTWLLWTKLLLVTSMSMCTIVDTYIEESKPIVLAWIQQQDSVYQSANLLKWVKMKCEWPTLN